MFGCNCKAAWGVRLRLTRRCVRSSVEFYRLVSLMREIKKTEIDPRQLLFPIMLIVVSGFTPLEMAANCLCNSWSWRQPQPCVVPLASRPAFCPRYPAP